MRALACATALTGLALTGCSTYRDGDSLARDEAEGQAAQLAERLGYRNRVRDAEYIAATEILERAPGDDSPLRVTPFAWSGRTAGDEQATIDVRFVVTLAEHEPQSIGANGSSAGQATRCYRYVLQLYRDTGYREIDCPAAVTPAVPTAAPIPSLPNDATERLSAVLRTATPETLADSVRAAFPEDHISVDTAVHKGGLVAAVGVPAERECLLLVRNPGGAIESPGYRRIQLEPGEQGCSTKLFISPAR